MGFSDHPIGNVLLVNYYLTIKLNLKNGLITKPEKLSKWQLSQTIETRICIASKTSEYSGPRYRCSKILFVLLIKCIKSLRPQTQESKDVKKTCKFVLIWPSSPFISLSKIDNLICSECIWELLSTFGFWVALSSFQIPCCNGEVLSDSFLLCNTFRGNPFYTLTCLSKNIV